jgi:uncharacterized protein (TIGR00725 family)
MQVTRRLIIAVIGSSTCSPNEADWAESVGQLLARAGATLICVGRGGVMEAASRGASAAGGLVVGVLPGASADEANPFVHVPIVSGMGEARNAIIVRSAQAVIAIGGEYGTLSEIAFALCFGVPVVCLGSWDLKRPDGQSAPLHPVSSPEEAVRLALVLARHE